MSSLGKMTRMNRIFSHPSGRILAVAVDHFINYPVDMPCGLKNMQETLAKIVAGGPNSITMTRGIAKRFMPPHAGCVPVIIQQLAVRPDDNYFAPHGEVEEILALGADAIAVSICLKGTTEAMQVRHLADVVSRADRIGLPVVSHIYPLILGEKNRISNSAEDIAYAVRIGLEMGVDVIKVPYTGDIDSFRDIVSVTPVPVVTAGGPKCETLEQAAAMIRDVVKTGAAGSTVGRNVWGFADCAEAIRVLKAAMFDS